MLLRVDFDKELFCDLYSSIYKRLLNFAAEHNTDRAIIKQRMNQLTNNDNNIHMLIDLNDTTGVITAHCLLVFLPNSDGTFIAFCEQLAVDTGHNSNFVESCIEYVKDMPQVTCARMLCDEKKARAFKKKYHFEVEQILMQLDFDRNTEV